MTPYANGYKPTLNLRQYVVARGHGVQPDVTVLQQEWQSDFQGFPPVWRDVPRYIPAEGERRNGQ